MAGKKTLPGANVKADVVFFFDKPKDMQGMVIWITCRQRLVNMASCSRQILWAERLVTVRWYCSGFERPTSIYLWNCTAGNVGLRLETSKVP